MLVCVGVVVRAFSAARILELCYILMFLRSYIQYLHTVYVSYVANGLHYTINIVFHRSLVGFLCFSIKFVMFATTEAHLSGDHRNVNINNAGGRSADCRSAVLLKYSRCQLILTFDESLSYLRRCMRLASTRGFGARSSTWLSRRSTLW